MREPDRSWSTYTDHNPLEIAVLCNIRWEKKQEETPAPAPHYARLLGNTEETNRLRTELGEKMDEALEREASSCWNQVCQIPLETAAKVHWLNGREQDLQILDEEV